MLEHTFQYPLPRGLHARPASQLQSVARAFTSSISIRNVRNNRVANAHSVFSLIGADIREGDMLHLSVCGEDQDKAIAALRRYTEEDLPYCDDPLESPETDTIQAVLPYSLNAAHPTYLKGIPVVTGIAQAVLCVARGARLPTHLNILPDDPLAEKAKVDRARSRLVASIESQMQARSDDTAGQILYVHQCMLKDEEFIETLNDGILTKRYSAAQSILHAWARFTETFKSCENVIINERALDVEDLCAQLLTEIYGPSVLLSEPTTLRGPSILATDHLTPSAFLALDKNLLKGLVLGTAGTTSHTVILARARGIPTLVGMDLAPIEPHAGTEVMLDGALGLLVVEPNTEVKEYYRLEQIKLRLRQDRLDALRCQRVTTRDGVSLEIGANIACADDARVAFDAGADGIGLFRTEMLYMDRDKAPEEDEQYAIYREVLSIAQGRPVIFRTLDVGGDKPVPCLATQSRSDSALDSRGIQFYVKCEPVFRAQLRALLRASACGPARIMIPMINTLAEVQWVTSILSQVKAELAHGRVDHDASVPLGAMIETPVAASIVDRLCEDLNFFSIGTNDLTQYHLSVDRAQASQPSSVYHPSLLRLLARIVEQAHQGGKWIGVCGEMAADNAMLPLWLGLGVDEISVTPTAIAGLKAEVRDIGTKEAQRLVRDLAESADAEQVRDKLLRFRKTQHRFGVFDPELILTGVEATTKEQAIKMLVDRLYVVGRTEDPTAVENALWQRESTYSTGLGFGFAIPHCDCEALLADTISVMKLTQPIEWGSVDGQPVSVLIFLGRWRDNSSAHLQAFATLSRCLMREDFRQSLQQENDASRLVHFLQDHMGIA